MINLIPYLLLLDHTTTTRHGGGGADFEIETEKNAVYTYIHILLVQLASWLMLN